jgi:cytochrome c oxidase subunit 2
MKTLLKSASVALAIGLSAIAVSAQTAPAPNSGNPAPLAAPAQAPTAAPAQALPAAPVAQPLPAPPSSISDPAIANITGEEPTDAQVAQSTVASRTTPMPGIGQPDGRMGLQDQFTPIGEEAAWFHNVILMPLITAISLLVLVLLIYVVIRYRRRAHVAPSRTSHNTLIEVLWTLIPVLILVAIAVPSIKLLANQYSPPKADLTVKVIGNQWYWTYQYPDNGDFEIVSNGLSDADAKARGEPRQLAVDERMVVPTGATVKLIVTSADVLHAFALPAFWVKMDAVPGRLNETWFKVDKPGVYYGQCSELCGARHAYMPIAIEVLPPAQYAAWVRSKGGTLPGEVRPTSSDATVNSPLGNATPASGALTNTAGSGATETTPDLGDNRIVDVTTTAPVSSQGATNSRRGGAQ